MTGSKSARVYVDPMGSRMVLEKAELQKLTALAENGSFEAMESVYGHYTFGRYDKSQSRYWLTKLAQTGDPIYRENLQVELMDDGEQTTGD